MDVKVTRRGILGMITVAAGVGALNGAEAQPAEAVTFMAIGDWGRRGEPHQRAVAGQMGNLAAQAGSSFTLALGDNFYGKGVLSTDDEHWKDSFEDVYTAPSLQHRWYAILGNHDYQGNPQAQIDYSKISKRWMMPARYYVIGGETIGAPYADLFMLDTSPLMSHYRAEPVATAAHRVHDQDPQAQYRWLDKALSESKASWKIVFGHHPIFSGGQHGDSQDLVDNLLPILKRHKVNAYVFGHDHDMQHIEREGIHFIATGCGSTVRPVDKVEGTRFAMSQSGFSLYRLTPASLELSFYDWAASKLYEVKLTKAA